MYKCCLLIVAIVFTVCHAQVQICPDKWALQNVSAWKSFGTGYKGQYNESINFHTLDNYVMIHIVKANVSVLCEGMIKNFFRLEYLALTNANISTISPKAFEKLPSLKKLSLAVNRLTSIDKNQLKNLENLTILYLSSNKIYNIDSDAFINLVNLKKIYLDRNQIAEIESRWFLNNNKIRLINLAFNRISILQSAAFTLPKYSTVKISLQNNQIEKTEQRAVISEGTDEEEPYLTLHLDHNKLTSISSDFIESMGNLHSTLYFNFNSIPCVSSQVLNTLKSTPVNLYLLKNPLTCECMKDVANFLKNTQIRGTFYYNTTIECYLYGVPTPLEWEQRFF